MAIVTPPSDDRVGAFWVALYYFVTFASFGIFLPYLPQWLEARGVTGLMFGAVVAMRPLMTIVSPVVFGVIADRSGLRGRLLVIACLLSSGSMAVLAALAALPGALGFAAVFAMLSVYAFFRAPVVSVADVTAIEGRRQGYGAVRLWGSLGFLSSSLVGGMLLDTTSQIAFPATVSAAMLLGSAVALKLPRGLKTPPTPTRGAARALFARPHIRIFLLTGFLWMASHTAYDVCISLHLRDLGGSDTAIGLAWALGSAFEIILMANGGRLLTRLAPQKLLIAGLAAMILRWLSIAFIPVFEVVLALQWLHALSFALVWLAALEFIRQQAPPDILATVQGGFSAVISLGSVLAMLVWGPLYAAHGGPGVYATAAAVAALSTSAAIWLYFETGAKGRMAG